MTHLLVTLQTHSESNNPAQNGKVRYGCNYKSEITRRSLLSLLNTINHAIKNAKTILNVELVVVDDHSSDTIKDFIKRHLASQTFQTKFIELGTFGINKSLEFCYNYLKTNGKNLVYLTQDDYLYEDSCIFEMIDAYFQFCDLTKTDVTIYPFDEPSQYYNNYFYRIVDGVKRRWRTDPGAGACAFLSSINLLRNNWDLYEAFYKHEMIHEMEINTINKLISERHVLRFSPLGSLAIHFQYETEKDPYFDWATLWEKYQTNDTYYFEDKTVLNIGCGTTSCGNLFPGYKEVKIDYDSACNPDVVASLLNLEMFVSKSADICYSSHSLEHLHLYDFKNAIHDMIRISREKVVFVVPNLKVCFKDNLLDKIYDSPSGSISAMDILYGHTEQTHTNKLMEHKCGFTKQTLSYILTGYNFSIKETDLDLYVEIYV